MIDAFHILIVLSSNDRSQHGLGVVDIAAGTVTTIYQCPNGCIINSLNVYHRNTAITAALLITIFVIGAVGAIVLVYIRRRGTLPPANAYSSLSGATGGFSAIATAPEKSEYAPISGNDATALKPQQATSAITI